MESEKVYSVKLHVTYNYIVRDHDGCCSGADASDHDDDYYRKKNLEHAFNILKTHDALVHVSNIYKVYKYTMSGCSYYDFYLKSHLLKRISYVHGRCTSSGSQYCHGFGKKYTATQAKVEFDYEEDLLEVEEKIKDDDDDDDDDEYNYDLFKCYIN